MEPQVSLFVGCPRRNVTRWCLDAVHALDTSLEVGLIYDLCNDTSTESCDMRALMGHRGRPHFTLGGGHGAGASPAQRREPYEENGGGQRGEEAGATDSLV